MAGYRTGLKRSNLPETVGGARAKFTVPSTSNLNTAGLDGSNLYFFVNVNSSDGKGNLDGGIVKRGDLGDKWYAFFCGDGVPGGWLDKQISAQDGKTVDIKVLTEQYVSGGRIISHTIKLFLDGVSILPYEETMNPTNPGGISSIYQKTIAKTTAEVTIVPKGNKWGCLNSVKSINGVAQQAFIKNASFTNVYPIIRTTGTDYTGGTLSEMVNCDTDFSNYSDYYQMQVRNSVSKVCTVHSSSSRSMSSTIDINKAGKIF